MYRAFFGFRERPFDLTPNPRFLVLTDAHREALSNLDYGIASRRGITLLVGEAGTGKTTVIRTALERQPDRVHCIHIHNPVLTRPEFVEMLAARFELSQEARTSKTAFLLELETLMRERHARGESTVLVIDEAQTIPLELLEEVRMLVNIETNETKLLSVVLAGQPELATRLRQDSLRQLKQRIALRCELRPLTMPETLGYVAGRIATAGGTGSQVFTREAVMLLHERAGGIPRTISVIADNALLTGFAMGRRPVGRSIVQEVCSDLDLQAPLQDAAPDVAPPVTPEAPAVAPVSVTTRVLGFDAPGVEQFQRASAPAQAPARRPVTSREADKTASADDAHVGMFSNMYPKRRRFLFFDLTR